jgi:hypothetical protein
VLRWCLTVHAVVYALSALPTECLLGLGAPGRSAAYQGWSVVARINDSAVPDGDEGAEKGRILQCDARSRLWAR